MEPAFSDLTPRIAQELDRCWFWQRPTMAKLALEAEALRLEANKASLEAGKLALQAERLAFEKQTREAKLVLEKGPPTFSRQWLWDEVAPDLMVAFCTTTIAAAYRAPLAVQIISPLFAVRVDRFCRWATRHTDARRSQQVAS
jgi:hypothetical protein